MTYDTYIYIYIPTAATYITLVWGLLKLVSMIMLGWHIMIGYNTDLRLRDSKAFSLKICHPICPEKFVTW